MRPGLDGDVEHLFGQLAAIFGTSPEAGEFDRSTAYADADDRPAIGELVEQVAVLGETQRMVERRHRDAEAQPRALDLRRQVRREHERVGKGVVVGEVVLGEEDRVEAGRVGFERLLRRPRR